MYSLCSIYLIIIFFLNLNFQNKYNVCNKLVLIVDHFILQINLQTVV